jgi:hypothetical protein
MISTSSNLLVLHALRCVGSTVPARLAAVTGIEEPGVESELIDLAVAGLVTFDRGEFGGWSLTDAGRVADAERVAAEVDAAGVRPAVTAAYHRFLELNPELLDVCTAWQTIDHSEPARVDRVLARLIDVDRRAAGVCADLAAAVPRFGRYRVRLADALARVRAGDPNFVAYDLEAYHTVWFQLHEDLLATLGIPR